jgi:type III pantothenate kinase
LFLAVDIGNTQTSFGFIQDEKITHHFRLQTKAFRTPDEYASFLFPLLQLHKIAVADIEKILLCSVVPPADPFFEDFCQHYFKQKPFKVTPQSRLMFKMNLKTPEEVGADRIANVAYAVENFPLPCMVIDIGTATTFDVISKERSYEGGIIFPGVGLCFDALGSKTAKLPLLDPQFSETVIGKSTVECIRSGVLNGYCSFLEGMIQKIENELKADCYVAMTGGHSVLFKNRLQKPFDIYPDLTLQGIFLLYKHSTVL